MMNIDKIIMNKIVEKFNKLSKPELINQCNVLFDIVWKNQELKERLLSKIEINVPNVIDLTKVSKKTIKQIEDEEIQEYQKQKDLEQKKKKLQELKLKKEEVNLPKGIKTNDELMEVSVKEVIEGEYEEEPELEETKKENKKDNDIEEMMG